MKKMLNLVIMLCMVSIFPAITVFATTVPEPVDQYGINISHIDSLRYEKELKAKIKEATKYTESLYSLLTKHYCMLLENEENVDDYVSFYREYYNKATDPLLKETFHQRMIRGLFRKGNKEEAETELKRIDRKIVESNLHELGYYKILLTYQNFDGTAAKKSYDDAISFYETNKLYGFDLACLYNDYGILHEEKEPERAYTLYKKGIRLSDSKTMLSLLLRNIKDVARNNKGMRKGIYQDAFSYLNSLQNNECKINLMTRMLEIRFFTWDTRKQRQLMDKLYSCAEKTNDDALLYDCYFALANKEDSDSNYLDAVGFYTKCGSVCKRNEWKNRLLLIEAYSFLSKSKVDKEIITEEGIKKIVYDVSNCKAEKSSKAIIFAKLAECCIINKKLSCYCLVLSAAKNGGCYANVTSILAEGFLLSIFDDTAKYSTEEIRQIIGVFDNDAIQIISLHTRSLVSLHLSLRKENDLAKLWEPAKNKDFFIQIIAIEKLIQTGSADDAKKALSMLQMISPLEFDIDDIHFSKDDAEAWILNDKLAILLTGNAISEYVPILKRLEELLPKCSEFFLKSMEVGCIANMGGAYVSLGENEKSIPLITAALGSCSSENMYYGMWSTNLGLAYLQQGNAIEASKFFRSAQRVFRRQNNTFMYVRASVNLALAITATDNADLNEANHILDECITLATKECFNDDLSRAYTIKMNLVKKNKNLTRKEKIAEIDAIENKCVSITSNPTILAEVFFMATMLKHDGNFPASSVIVDIEKYFQYQKLFSSVLVSVDEDSILVQRDKVMKDLLFKILEEIGDTKKIDYWNKIFERDRTRSVELQSQQAKIDTKMLSVLALISKFENAQQILAHEQSKKESDQDKLLIQKALKLKREIEQQYELARKNLSAKDLKLFEALLSDNFIIHPDSLSQLSSILPTGTACLQFLNVGENIIAYIAVKDTPPFTVSISLKEKGLTQKKFSQKLIKVRNLLQNKANVSTVNKELAELYSILFSEMEKPLEKLNVKSIVVNASGILRYVPMATLYDGKKYLIEKYQVTNITGLDLIRLSKNNGARAISDVKAAIFADPDGSLPSGRNEGQSIAQFFANKKLYLGDKASLTEFESMVGNVNFVHLATHAVLDPNEPSKSYIQFADGKKWYYSDMMGFNIRNVDSIALSACETAVSEKSTGGEIEGMAYQLLKKSPSGSVLASFWKVDDTATAMLMGIYYKHVTDSIKTNHTLDRGGALREAQLNLLKKPDTSHPYYWAAFTLFGDFR